MLFWKKVIPKPNQTTVVSIPETKPAENNIPPIELKSIIEDENDKEDFTTIDVNLAFSLQDKFTVKAVYFDKHNNGFKTFVFNATNKEIENYLKEVKC
jgi:hypothetical protein